MYLLGEERQPAGTRGPGACDVELADILGSDVAVRAAVDDVDALDSLAIEPVDRLGDHAAGHHRLSEPDLICNEESARRVRSIEKAVKRVLDRRALKVLEAPKHLIWIDADAHARDFRTS